MIAYTNPGGTVLAVFYTEAGGYRVYIRCSAGENFKTFGNVKGKFMSRADAEAALTSYINKSFKKDDWNFYKDWSGQG